MDTPSAEYVVFQAVVPGREAQDVGVIVLDAQGDKLYCKFVTDWETLAGQDAEVFAGFVAKLPELQQRMGGGRALLAYMEETFSNAMQLTARESTPVRDSDFQTTVDALFAERIGKRGTTGKGSFRARGVQN